VKDVDDESVATVGVFGSVGRRSSELIRNSAVYDGRTVIASSCDNGRIRDAIYLYDRLNRLLNSATFEAKDGPRHSNHQLNAPAVSGSVQFSVA